MSLEVIALSLITLLAATVNCALGYGFSSLTVPLALNIDRRAFRAADALVAEDAGAGP